MRTLQEWEQGCRAASGAARTLLFIAQKNPLPLRNLSFYCAANDVVTAAF